MASLMVAAVAWLKYCRYGVKTIQSIINGCDKTEIHGSFLQTDFETYNANENPRMTEKLYVSVLYDSMASTLY